MHVGKPSDRWSLTSHMHGRCVFEMPQPARVGVVVYQQRVKDASFALVNFLRVFLNGFWLMYLIVR